ncbi:hypothetical protein [Puniceibacterium sp. IMCC21224]|uniref:hypothetical protein n=1 Tax=Puniceibacterium sp. IMCC21224 TaxID=1618204 RepID=UPI00064D98D9|nr:hypothetical protein [Puniceibacterium sp. IMCC21224]KMK67526.1 hypothetical protein IMCC21224_112397 [Puniceibacterium sp. IMCC21224]
MKYAFRKQSKTDFNDRLRRLNSSHGSAGSYRQGADTNSARPILFTLLGFAWFYTVITVAERKSHLKLSLVQGNLPAQYHDMIMAGLGALLAVSGVMLVLHLVRYLMKRGAKRSNSGGILVGALVAATLVYTPPSVFEAGFGMLDSNSRSLIMAASSTVTGNVSGLDWSAIQLVSSYSK